MLERIAIATERTARNTQMIALTLWCVLGSIPLVLILARFAIYASQQSLTSP